MIPQSVAMGIFQVIHNTTGHFGVESMEPHDLRYFYCPKHNGFVRNVKTVSFIKGLLEILCLWKSLYQSPEPFKLIAMDFLTLTSWYLYVLLCVDHFSNFAIVLPIWD